MKKTEIMCFISVIYESGNVPCVFHQLLCNKNDFFILRVTFCRLLKTPQCQGWRRETKGREKGNSKLKLDSWFPASNSNREVQLSFSFPNSIMILQKKKNAAFN